MLYRRRLQLAVEPRGGRPRRRRSPSPGRRRPSRASPRWRLSLGSVVGLVVAVLTAIDLALVALRDRLPRPGSALACELAPRASHHGCARLGAHASDRAVARRSRSGCVPPARTIRQCPRSGWDCRGGGRPRLTPLADPLAAAGVLRALPAAFASSLRASTCASEQVLGRRLRRPRSAAAAGDGFACQPDLLRALPVAIPPCTARRRRARAGAAGAVGWQRACRGGWRGNGSRGAIRRPGGRQKSASRGQPAVASR